MTMSNPEMRSINETKNKCKETGSVGAERSRSTVLGITSEDVMRLQAEAEAALAQVQSATRAHTHTCEQGHFLVARPQGVKHRHKPNTEKHTHSSFRTNQLLVLTQTFRNTVLKDAVFRQL